jgi:WD40 repeat protein
VVVTLRADFYDRPLLYDGFANLIRQRTEVVIPMTPQELELAIVGPAKRIGLGVEPALVSTIVEDLRSEPGMLPLLQYALTEAFERRTGNMLTLQGYRVSGGASGALARRAEETYEKLSSKQQKITRQIFLRLVTLGEGTEDTRRRILISELRTIVPELAVLNAILDSYGKYRLLTFDNDLETREPTIEIAHEAMIRSWTRLHNWLDESRNDVRLERMLSLAAFDWIGSKRDPSFLLRGVRLAQFEEWKQITDLILTTSEKEYLEASIAHKRAESEAEAARQAKEKELMIRARQRLQAIVVLLCVGTLIASLLLIMVFNQSRTAQQERDNAQVARDEAMNARATSEINAMEANSLALASAAQLALRDKDYDLAALLAVEANQVEKPALQSQLTLAQIAYSVGTYRRIEESSAINAIAISPDGKYIVVGLRNGNIHLWDIEQSQQVRTFEGHLDRITGIVFSNDGRWIVSGSWDDTARLWDVQTGETLRVFSGHTDNVLSVALSPHNDILTTTSNDNTLRLWNIQTGELVHILEEHTAPVHTSAFSHDNRLLLSGGDDNTLYLWDISNGKLIRTFLGHSDRITAVAFHPTLANRMLSASRDGTLRLWDIATGDLVRIFEGHQDRINAAVFSPDGRFIYSAARDTNIWKWDTETGEVIEQLSQHNDDVLGLAMSADGRWLVSGSSDLTIRVWDIDPMAPLQSFSLEDYTDITSIDISSNGNHGVMGSSKGLWLWDYATMQLIWQVAPQNAVTLVSFSADGTSILGVIDARTITLWDVLTGEERLSFENEGHNGIISSVVFSPDYQQILSGSWDTTAILWDAQTGEILQRFIGGHEDRIFTVAFHPTHPQVLTGSFDGSLVLWDATTGNEIRRFLGLQTSVEDLLFLNDTHFVSALGDGTIRVWDVTTGQEVRRYEGHRSTVTSIVVNPQGDTMFSASQDNSLILWDIASGVQIQRFAIDNVSGLAFMLDGLRGISATGNSVYLWRTLSLNGLSHWVMSNRYLPELTCDQRLLYHIDEGVCP